MKLDRPLLIIDLESTGVDPMQDRIVQLGVSVLHPDGTVNPRGWQRLINPTIPIPAAATAVHHITDEMVANELPFSAWAQKLYERFQGKDLAGFNLRRFDLPLLDEEFRRCGLRLETDGVRIVDVFGIFSKKNPRKLEDAVRIYCGREYTGEHGAGADTSETLDVLLGQIAKHEDLAGMNLDYLAALSLMAENPPADLAGKFWRDEEGDLRFSFGKNQGAKVRQQLGYARWMMEKGSFPGSTLDVLQAELERVR